MNIRIDLFHHFAGDELASLVKELLMANKRIEDALARIDAATTDIANDIRALKDQIGTGMSQAEVDAVSTTLEDKAAALEAIGGQTDSNAQEVKAAAG